MPGRRLAFLSQSSTSEGILQGLRFGSRLADRLQQFRALVDGLREKRPRLENR